MCGYCFLMCHTPGSVVAKLNHCVQENASAQMLGYYTIIHCPNYYYASQYFEEEFLQLEASIIFNCINRDTGKILKM